MAAEGLDPRGGPVEPSPRPLVARPRAGLSSWMIAAGVLVAGLVLFLILDARRRQLSAPATAAPPSDRRAGGEPPVLYVPPIAAPVPVAAPPPPPPPAPPPVPAQPRTVYIPAPPVPQPVQVQPQQQRNAPGPVLVLDTTTGEAGSNIGGGPTPAGANGQAEASVATGGPGSLGGRARASVLRNKATTVPQGSLIPAVLETALDSTRPGPARALVTRDVRGFDGSKVLIPRGSRLIGEYKADLEPGQNRALVIWNRLVRPDGVTIELGSPSADPLGRVGIRGKVNSHFLERFGNAFLQTALSVGSSLAASGLAGNNNNVAVLALPGTVTTATSPLVGTQDIRRTLRVRQGVSVSVFVARDLDFTAVEARK